MIKKGNLSMLQVILVFIIILASVIMTGGSLGKKVTEGARDFNIPIPGTYCPGDVGEVPYEVYMENIKQATKVAWNGKKACWLRQKLKPAILPDVNPIIIWDDILDHVSISMTGKIGFTGDDCLASGEPTIPSDASIDLVFWWDDQQACSSGILSGPVGWVGEKVGESIDTLYLYPRKDYCVGGSNINWYNPARRSNIYQYSLSKGRSNDANVCMDETDSGGDDLGLPNVLDLTGGLDANVQTDIINDIKLCIQNYEEFFMGGFGTLTSHGDNEYDTSENYMACPHTYLFKPKANWDLNEFIPPSSFISAHFPTYKETGNFLIGTTYSSDWDSCDILNDAKTEPNYGEFNSVTWHRDSKDAACLYYIKDRFIKTYTELINTPPISGNNQFIQDNIYKITAFYYFEKDDTPIQEGYNDIIFVIDEQKSLHN